MLYEEKQIQEIHDDADPQHGGYDAQFEQTPGRLSLRKKIEAQMRVETNCGRKQNQSRFVNTELLGLYWNQIDAGKWVFEARVTENVL
ncbi:hypothetical protein YC2023_102087 [Brassica napus]